MSSNCIYLNILQHKDVSDTLDGYVVLAFLLALILTIIIVILLVRYIVLQLQKQRDKEQHLKENRHLRKLRRSSENDDSTDDYQWSDSETVDLNAGYDELDIDNESNMSVDNLETNYIHSFSEKENFETISNNYGDVLMEIFNDCIDLDSVGRNKAPFFSTFLHIEDSHDTVHQHFQDYLLQMIQLRKNAFSLLVDLVLESLHKSLVISQELFLLLKSKYNQKLEMCESLKGFQQVFATSLVVQEITKQINIDIKNHIDVEHAKRLEQCLNVFFTTHLDCLKLFSLGLKKISEDCNFFKMIQLQCFHGVNKILTMVKYRIFYIDKAISEVSQTPDVKKILQNHRTKLTSALDEADNYLIKQLQEMMLEVNKQRQHHLDQLTQKIKTDEINLKHEILKTDGKNLEDKLELFQQYFLTLYSTELAERNDLLLKLAEYEEKEIRDIFTTVQKFLMQNINENEEEMFSALQNELHFTDDQVLSIIENVQNLLKGVKQKHADNSADMIRPCLESNKTQSVTIATMVDHLIKQVSHEFKYLINTSSKSIKLLPPFDQDDFTVNVSIIRNNLSVAAFDMVVVVANHIIDAIKQGDVNDLENTGECFSILNVLKQAILSESDGSTVEIAYEDLLGNLTKLHAVKSDDISYVEIHHSHHSALMNTFHKHVFKPLEDEINNFYCETILKFHSSHMNVYKTFKKLLKKHHKTPDPLNDEKKKKYLSRKSSSFKEKSIEEELLDIYMSHVNMRNNKHNETFQQLQKDANVVTSKASKSTAMACIKVFEEVSEFIEMDIAEYLTSAFDTVQHYMLERMLKKLLKYSEELYNVPSDEEDVQNGATSDTVAKYSKTKSKLLSQLEQSEKIETSGKKSSVNRTLKETKHRGRNVISPVGSATNSQKNSKQHKNKGSAKLKTLGEKR